MAKKSRKVRRHPKKATTITPPPVVENSSIRDQLYSLVQRWRRSLIGGSIAAAVAVLAVAIDAHEAQDWIQGVFDSSRETARKADTEAILNKLDELTTQMKDAKGGALIRQATGREVRKRLVEASPGEQTVLEELREGRVDDAIKSLVSKADGELRSADSARRDAADSLYFAGLLAARSNYATGAALMSRAIEADPTSLKISSMLALLQLNLGRSQEALELLNRFASDYSRASPDDQIIYEDSVGLVALGRNDLVGAEKAFGRLFLLGQEQNDLDAKVSATGNLGIVYSHKGDRQKAIFYYSLSNTLNGNSDTEKMGNQYCNLGHQFITGGQFDKARENFLLALAAFSRSDSKDCLANTYIGMGIIALHDNDEETAERYFSLAKITADKLGDRVSQIITRIDVSDPLYARGDYDGHFRNLLEAMRFSIDPELSDEVFQHIIPITQNAVDTAVSKHRERQLLPFRDAVVDSLSKLAVELRAGDSWDSLTPALKDPNESKRRAVDLFVTAALLSCVAGDRASYFRYGRDFFMRSVKEQDLTMVSESVGIVAAYQKQFDYCPGPRDTDGHHSLELPPVAK